MIRTRRHLAWSTSCTQFCEPGFGDDDQMLQPHVQSASRENFERLLGLVNVAVPKWPL